MTDELTTVEPTFKDNISKISDNKLCEVVVAYRYLGMMREEAIMSMEELAARRAAGNTFDYEAHIEKLIEPLPKIRLEMAKAFKIPGLF